MLPGSGDTAQRRRVGDPQPPITGPDQPPLPNPPGQLPLHHIVRAAHQIGQRLHGQGRRRLAGQPVALVQVQQPHGQPRGDGRPGQRLTPARGDVPGEQFPHQRHGHSRIGRGVLAQCPDVDGPGANLGQRVDPHPFARTPERQFPDEIAAGPQIVNAVALAAR